LTLTTGRKSPYGRKKARAPLLKKKGGEGFHSEPSATRKSKALFFRKFIGEKRRSRDREKGSGKSSPKNDPNACPSWEFEGKSRRRRLFFPMTGKRGGKKPKRRERESGRPRPGAVTEKLGPSSQHFNTSKKKSNLFSE